MQHPLPIGTLVETPPDDAVIRIARRFEAPRLLVWRCFTEPMHMVRFWGPRDVESRIRLDLRAGGLWVTEWTYPGGNGFAFTSVYLDITAPHRFSYRDAPNGWAGGLENLPPPRMTTAVTLTEAGDGTDIDVLVRYQTLAERDGDVERGFASTVSTGFDRLAAMLPDLLKGEA